MNDWLLKKLCDVAFVSAGTSAPQGDHYFEGGEFNFVRTQDVGRYGFTTSLIETKDKVNQRAISEKRLKLVRKGASVFPKSGASILTNSRAVLGVNSYVVSHLAIVEAKQELLDDYYLHYFLRTIDFGEISQSEEGYPSLRLSEISNIEIPIPSLDIQRRIVARIEELIHRAEEARKLRQETVSQIEIAIAAALNLVFGENQLRMKNWKLEPIRLVVEKKETWNPRKDNRTQVQYLEISSIDNSTGKIINTRSIEASNPPSRAKRIIRKGDVVFGTTRPYLKNIAIVPEDLNKQVCSTGLCVLRPRPERVITEWLFNVCRSDTVVDQVIPGQEKHAYPAVSDDAILNSLIPVPPLDKQGQIVSWIKKLTSRAVEIHKLQRESDAEQEIFNSALLAKAFRGEL